MSPWAPEATEQASQGPDSQLNPKPAGVPAGPLPTWTKVSAFFMSGVLFSTGILIPLAPLPILLLRLKRGRGAAWLATLTNIGVVAFLGGLPSLGIYTSLILSVALVLPELLLKGRSVERAAGGALLAMGVIGSIWVLNYARTQHIGPFQAVDTQISRMLDLFLNNLPDETKSALLSTDTAEEWKQSVIIELPWRGAVLGLIMVWLNVVLILRINPQGLRERLGIDGGFYRRWKAPEWLIWPAILAGFFLVVEVSVVSVVSLNVFMFLMGVFAIQGMSILSYFFDLWRIQGPMRSLGFLMSVFLMLPLLVGLGFFDQWFDFRAKLRQS